MFATRFALSSLSRVSLSQAVKPQVFLRSQGYASGQSRIGLRRGKAVPKSQAVSRETTQARIGAAFGIGQGVLAGGAVLGLGALCYYGLGMSSSPGAIDNYALWSDLVKERIRTTYGYFGASLAFTAASAVTMVKNQSVMNFLGRGGWAPLLVSLAAMWGSGMLCMSLPYQEGIGAKQAAWVAHSAIVGTIIAPLMMLGGSLIAQAALYTAGMVAGLSTVAVCAPSEKFLNWGGPLAMGFGVVLVASLGSYFVPPTSVLGAGMYSVAMYGGLVLFGMFLLYDTQKIIRNAETTPEYGGQHKYDPINNAVRIYVDTINIFVRMVAMLAGNRKK